MTHRHCDYASIIVNINKCSLSTVSVVYTHHLSKRPMSYVFSFNSVTNLQVFSFIASGLQAFSNSTVYGLHSS